MGNKLRLSLSMVRPVQNLEAYLDCLCGQSYHDDDDFVDIFDQDNDGDVDIFVRVYDVDVYIDDHADDFDVFIFLPRWMMLILILMFACLC